jgi:N-acyl-D-amino-acid deacylase
VGSPPEELPEWTSFSEYLQLASEARPAVNLASLVGHGTIRGNGSARSAGSRRGRDVGDAASAGGGAEGRRRRSLHRARVPPGMYATTRRGRGARAATRRRGRDLREPPRAEGELLWDAVDEAIEIGRRASVPAHISHLKLETEFVWGMTDELLGRLFAARREATTSPPTSIRTPPTRRACRRSFRRGLPWRISNRSWPTPHRPSVSGGASWRESLGGGWQSSVRGVGRSASRWSGTAFAARSGSASPSSGAGTARPVRRGDGADPRRRGDDRHRHAMQEPDVETILADPEVMVGTDGLAVSPTGPLGAFGVHPRYYGRSRGSSVAMSGNGESSTCGSGPEMTSIAADRFGSPDAGASRGSVRRPRPVRRGADLRRGDLRRSHRFPAASTWSSSTAASPGRRRAGDAVSGRSGRILRRS